MKCAVRARTKYCTPGVNVSLWYPKHSRWCSRWVPGNGNKLNTGFTFHDLLMGQVKWSLINDSPDLTPFPLFPKCRGRKLKTTF